MTTTLFSDEVQLAGWSDSHNSGAKVTFWLNDPAKLEAFRGLTERKGKTAGQRLAMVLVEIGDDEQPVEPPRPAEPEKEKLGKNCSLAVRWCDDVQFQSWLFRKYNVSEQVEVHKFMGQPTNIYAKAIVCKLCGIKTRKDLDPDDTEAANRFQTLIRLPYMKYQTTGVIE